MSSSYYICMVVTGAGYAGNSKSVGGALGLYEENTDWIGSCLSEIIACDTATAVIKDRDVLLRLNLRVS